MILATVIFVPILIIFIRNISTFTLSLFYQVGTHFCLKHEDKMTEKPNFLVIFVIFHISWHDVTFSSLWNHIPCMLVLVWYQRSTADHLYQIQKRGVIYKKSQRGLRSRRGLSRWRYVKKSIKIKSNCKIIRRTAIQTKKKNSKRHKVDTKSICIIVYYTTKT